MLDLLNSRKFWAAIVGLLAVCAEAFGKGFNQEELIGLLLIVVSYCVAVAINPGTNGSKLIETLKSRRFWAALIGIVVIITQVFDVKLPLSPENMIELAVVFSGYVIGVGLEGWKRSIAQLK